MKMRLLFSVFCALDLVVLLFCFEQRAYAYVDPGSGLLVFQVVGSMVAGAYFMFRRKLRQLFRLKHPLTESPAEANESPVDKAST